MIEAQKLDPDSVLIEAVTKNGEKFYFSDLLNWILFENMDARPTASGPMCPTRCRGQSRLLLPDIPEIVSHAARSIGTPPFGVPRVPPRARAAQAAACRAHEHWAMVRDEFVASGRDPAEWPYDLAAAARWQMLTSRDTLTLPLAAKIVMEAAVAHVQGRSAHGTGCVRGTKGKAHGFKPWRIAMKLTVIALNCTLKSSPEKSSTDRLLDEALAAFRRKRVTGEVVRVADLNIKPGVTSDESEGDDWPALRKRILAATFC